jgi:hypothetical protein
MQMTLLELTQNILSSLSSDEVNSISDNAESQQVAQILQNKYYDIVNRTALPEHEQLIQLEPSLDNTIPIEMFVPDGVTEIKWIKYFNTNAFTDVPFGTEQHGLNVDIVPTVLWSTTSTTSNTIGLGSKTFTVTSTTLPIKAGQQATALSGSNSMFGSVTSYVGSTLVMNITGTTGSGTFNSWIISALSSNNNPIPGYQDVTILPIKQFLDRINSYNPQDINVGTYQFTNNINGFPGDYTFYYKNDRQPACCTILSNFNIIFDSYDNTQDSTLQASKTMCWGRVIPAWQMVDTFVPVLDDEQFTLLLNEAKALAYFELKQSVHPKAEQEIKRGWSNVQKNKSVVNRPTYFDELPYFGRRGGMVNSRASYFKIRGWDSSNG